jgi:hypothetical protein
MPLHSQLHVDKLLSNVSIKYRNEDFIAMKVFPEVGVKQSTDLYRVYSRNFKLPETRRAIGGVSREHAFEVSNASYTLEWHSLKGYVADRQAENYDIADLRADTTEELSDKILLRLEKSVLDLFTTTNWSLNVSLAAANAFNANTTVSNPIPVFDTGASTVIANSGKKPNYGVMSREAFVAVKNHQSVLDRTKYTSADMDEVMIAALFGLPELLISNISYDTAAEGQAASLSSVLGDVAFLGWKPAKAGPLAPSAGYIFRNQRPMVKRWRVEEREADAIEVNMEYQAKVVASLCGYLIKDVI